MSGNLFFFSEHWKNTVLSLSLTDIFQDQGSEYSLRGSSGILYRVSPVKIPSKCWGWSNLVLMHWTQHKKTQLSTKYSFWKKSRKTSKKYHFWPKLPKMVIFLGFSWFFQKPYYVESWGFLCCVQCIETLLLSYQNQFFLAILPFVIIMGGEGGKILTRTTKIGPILKTKTVLKIDRRNEE